MTLAQFCQFAFVLVIPYLIKTFRMDYLLRVANFLSAAGSVIRIFAFVGGYHFTWITIGTFVMQCSKPILQGCRFALVNTWFSDKERALGLSIFGASSLLANFCSLLLSGWLYSNVDDPELTVDEQNAEVIWGTKTMVIIQICISCLCFFVFQSVIQEKPDTPPSSVANAPVKEHNLLEGSRQLLKNHNFVLILISRIFYGVRIVLISNL